MFASQSEAKITNLRIALANTKKKNLSTTAFLTQMQQIVDELASAGCTVMTREHVSFILAGLGGGYDAILAALGVATTPISLSTLYAQLHAYDQRQEMLHGSSDHAFETSANAASRQRRGRPNNKISRGDHGDRNDRRDDRYTDWRDDRYNDRRDERRDDRREDRRDGYGGYGRGGGRAPSGGGRGRGRGRRRTFPWVDATCQICNKAGISLKIVGQVLMMIMTMVIKRLMLPMELIQIGTRILMLLITSPGSSIT